MGARSAGKMALVLSGGGARAAYQAGVIKGIAEMIGVREIPFQILSGVSAGAINVSCLASFPDDFPLAAQRLWDFWKNLRPRDVFRTDAATLARTGTKWFKDLTLGGMVGGSRSNHLFDTGPLRALISKGADPLAIKEALRSGRITGIAFTATNYSTGTAVTFFDGHDSLQPWYRSSRMGMKEELGVDHILASSAIPIFFPPIQIGNAYYGDGGVRLSAPLSPAIHMGADSILGIGIRYFRPPDVTRVLNAPEGPGVPPRKKAGVPTLVDLAGVLLNSVFLDSFENDLEDVLRINRTVRALPGQELQSEGRRLRYLPILPVRPSKDLGGLANDHFHKLPMTLRYILKGFGASDIQGWDLLSYLAFDTAYTSQLLELGYADATALQKEVTEFFNR